jgi:uncharacterized caspase-like protein/WD40 repeat protein
MRWSCALLLATVSILVTSEFSRAEQARVDPAVMGEVLSLLGELGYIPGSATNSLDKETERALTLFNKAENPPELSGVQDKYVENLGRFRDALRASAAQRKRSAEQATVLLQTPHGDSSTHLIVDPEAKRAISTDETSIKGWDASTGRQVWSVNVPQIALSIFDNIAMSQDAKYVFSFGSAVRVYDAATGAVLRTFWSQKAEEIAALAPRPGTTELIVGEYGADKIVVYDWQTGRRLAELGSHSNGTWQDGNVKRWIVQHAITAIAVSADGRYAVSTAYDFGIRVWDLEQRRLLRFHPGPPGATFDNPLFLNDGRTVAVTSRANVLNQTYADSIFIFDIERGLVASKKSEDGFYISPAAEPASFFAYGDFSGLDGLHLFDATGQLKTSTDTQGLYDLIAGPANIDFDIENGRLVASRLDGSELWSVPNTEVGFDSLVAGKGGSGQNLLGQSGELLRFDNATGSIAKTAQLREADDDNECCAAPTFTAQDGRMFGFTIADDGPQIVAYSDVGKFVCKMPENLSRSEDLREIVSIDYAPDQDIVAQWVGDSVVLYSGRDCRELRRFRVTYATSTRPKLNPDLGKLFRTLPVGMRFSADGKTIFAWRAEDAIQAFNTETGKRTAVYRLSYENGDLSPVAAKIVADARKNRLLPLAWDVKPVPNSNKFVVLTGGTYYERNAHFGMVYVFEEGNPRWIAGYQLSWTPDQFALSPGGSRLLAKLGVQGLQSFDLLTGAHQGGFGAEPGGIKDATYSPDGRHVHVLAGDGALRTYDSRSGDLLVSTVGVSDGTWVSITPEGFFASSPGGESLVRLKRGTEMYDIDQVYQALYRPDLVKEKLAGDLNGLVKEAAAKLDLEKVLASGAAPTVSVLAPQDGASVGTPAVTVDVEIADSGGGIGRVEWRLNGVTAGVDEPAASADASLKLQHSLSLAPGENTIEVVAYNLANLVASIPSVIKVQTQAAEGQAKPRLIVLAAGVNDYADGKLQLNLAVPDAEALADAFSKTGGDLYESVDVTLLKDKDVTRDGLNTAFAAIAAKIKPGDVFAFFAAGHGKTVDGRYYYVPQDAQLSDLASVVAQGIAQEEWQKWFASIPAQRSVLLFDTCESGTLAADKADTKTLEQDAANGRLAQATGRTIITASSGSEAAIEGYGGHGLFTYNLLDALGKADGDGDGNVGVTELAGYVYAEVTQLSEQVFQHKQVPQVRLGGADHALTKAMTVLTTPQPGIEVATQPTHKVAAVTKLQIQPAFGARGIRKLDADTRLTAVKNEQGWVLVARDGRLLGYVAQRDLTPLQ